MVDVVRRRPHGLSAFGRGSVLAGIATLGLVPGDGFDPGQFDAEQVAEIDEGASAARTAILGSLTGFGTSANGRILATDAAGEPLVGEREYVMHFGADRLPPADAFRSVTMYDSEGFQAANPIDRFALGDRDPLRYNSDGSLDIHLSHTDPGPERRGNWLPAPLGPLGVTMRLYSPRPEVLDGRWSPPPVHEEPRSRSSQ